MKPERQEQAAAGRRTTVTGGGRGWSADGLPTLSGRGGPRPAATPAAADAAIAASTTEAATKVIPESLCHAHTIDLPPTCTDSARSQRQVSSQSKNIIERRLELGGDVVEEGEARGASFVGRRRHGRSVGSRSGSGRAGRGRCGRWRRGVAPQVARKGDDARSHTVSSRS